VATNLIKCRSIIQHRTSRLFSAHTRIPRGQRTMSFGLADRVRVSRRTYRTVVRPRWCDLDEPLRLDREYVVAVFARGDDDLVIDAPLGQLRPLEQRARWVDVNRRVLDERLVTPLPRILLDRVSEKPAQIPRRMRSRPLRRPATLKTSCPYRSIIPTSCLRTSLARHMCCTWMKCASHHASENPPAFHPSYVASSVRWSPSGWSNLAFLASACVRMSHGR
jgi:hypothetical protein